MESESGMWSYCKGTVDESRRFGNFDLVEVRQGRLGDERRGHQRVDSHNLRYLPYLSLSQLTRD